MAHSAAPRRPLTRTGRKLYSARFPTGRSFPVHRRYAMPLPTLTEEQRRDALAKAAEARKARAEIKAKLKNGTLGLAEILKTTADGVLGKMKVSAMLEALPGVGKVRAQKVMEELGISESRRIRGLGQKQREALKERFGKK